MAEPYKIYTLHDPDTLAVRYVGFTSKSLTKRLAVHIAAAAFGVTRTAVAYWIKTGKFAYANNQLKEVIPS